MSWKNAYKYIQGIAGKHGAAPAPQEDHDLPLGGRIGGMISMQKSPLIRAISNGSLIQMPGDGETLIKAASRVRLDFAGRLYRYYLDTGDKDTKEKFLQLFQDEAGKVTEILYCAQLARIIPESEDDQDAYTGRTGYGLGDHVYTLWREQLADMDLGDVDLDLVFGDSDKLEYRRDAGNPQTEFVAPFTGSETRIDDAFGKHGLKQQIYFMPYVRDLDGGLEYLLISTEIIESQDGDATRRGIHVDFMIGIPIELERVTIQ